MHGETLKNSAECLSPIVLLLKTTHHSSKGYVCAGCVAHNLSLDDTRSDDQIRDTRRSWNVVPKSRIKI